MHRIVGDYSGRTLSFQNLIHKRTNQITGPDLAKPADFHMQILKFPARIKDRYAALGFIVLAVILGFTCIWAWRQFITSPPYVDPERYPIRGIDVSRHNGLMNLDAAASDGIEFIFIKASEGIDFRDENFRINYHKARHAGLKIGAYHFFRFDRDGVLQAKNFLKAIGMRPLQLGVVIDVEQQGNPKDVAIADITERLTRMKEYLNLKGYRVTFYTNVDGYYEYLAENFPGSPLWICSFSEIPFNGEWTFWQYNHRGHVAGIRGDVDLNVFCGNRKEWESYLNGDVWPYTRQMKKKK